MHLLFLWGFQPLIVATVIKYLSFKECYLIFGITHFIVFILTYLLNSDRRNMLNLFKNKDKNYFNFIVSAFMSAYIILLELYLFFIIKNKSYLFVVLCGALPILLSGLFISIEKKKKVNYKTDFFIFLYCGVIIYL